MDQPTRTTQQRLVWAFILLLGLSSGIAISQEATSQDRTDQELAKLAGDIESFARTTLAELKAPPGLGIAVVLGDQILYAGGVGVRSLETKQPVDADTVFYIASSTKSFVGLTVALLAEEGLVNLDQPIGETLGRCLPDQAKDLTLRQLLTHTSGLANEPMSLRTAYTGDHSPEVLCDLLKLSRSKARDFDYSNLGYVIAGMVIEEATGKSWKQLVQERVLEPLAMSHTTSWMSKSEGWPNASAHIGGTEGSRQIDFVKTDSSMHAAGGLLSSANDMSQWLLAQTNQGRIGDEQVFSSDVLLTTQSSQVALDAKFFVFKRDGYGLGWYRSTYEEERLLHHFGGFPGFRAHVSFMPEHKIGVAILSNDSGHGFYVPDVIATYIYDLLLDRDQTIERAQERVDGLAKRITTRKDRAQKHLDERNKRRFQWTFPLAKYEGVYVHDQLGSATITTENNQIRVTVGQLSTLAEPYTLEDSLRVELVPGEGEAMQFEIEDQTVTGLKTFLAGAEQRWRRVAQDEKQE